MNNNKEISRRGFLKTAAALGAALTIQPAINKVQAANAVLGGTSASSTRNKDMQFRTLGTGSAAFEVSALGFGVMGMTYNRSQYPDKKTRQRVIAEAVDRGVTLFDTAIIYGPLNNEEFVGEVLAPYKNRVNVTTSSGMRSLTVRERGVRTVVRKPFAVIARNRSVVFALTLYLCSTSIVLTAIRRSKR